MRVCVRVVCVHASCSGIVAVFRAIQGDEQPFGIFFFYFKSSDLLVVDLQNKSLYKSLSDAIDGVWGREQLTGGVFYAPLKNQ